MCGIAGYMVIKGEHKDDDLNNLAQSLIEEISYRGRDAAGYAYPTEDGYVKYYKTRGKVDDFIKKAPMFVNENVKMPKVLLLHTRSSTGGTPLDNENNHPIVGSGLALIHNGYVFNDDKLKDKYKLTTSGKVDTEVILRLIQHYENGKGPEGDIERRIGQAMRKLSGLFACAMVSAYMPRHLWLWRRENPIHFTEFDGLFIFASQMADVRNIINEFAENPIDVKIKEMRNDRLLVCSTEKNELVRRTKSMPIGPLYVRKSRSYSSVSTDQSVYDEYWEGYEGAQTQSTQYYSPYQSQNRSSLLGNQLENRQCVVCGDGFKTSPTSGYLTCAPCDAQGYRLRISTEGDLKFPISEEKWTEIFKTRQIVPPKPKTSISKVEKKFQKIPSLKGATVIKDCMCGIQYETSAGSTCWQCIKCHVKLYYPVMADRIISTVMDYYERATRTF